MRHGSLFSGIGGFDLAAEWMGWENVFHCEWNTFGQKVLHHYWPNAEQFTDITKSDFTKYANTIDILTGGFPCQPYSSAGKRLGKEDERHLWPEMLRAIREIQPRWVVGENVLGLANWNGGLVFNEVQADLEAEGYEVQPYVLPAVSVNAPHRRDRVWFVAHSNLHGCNERNGNDEINASKGWLNALGDIDKSDGNGDATHTSSLRFCKHSSGKQLFVEASRTQFRVDRQNAADTCSSRLQTDNTMRKPERQVNSSRINGKDDAADTMRHRSGESREGGQSEQFDQNGIEGGDVAHTKHKGLEGQYREWEGCTEHRSDKGVFVGSEDKFYATDSNSIGLEGSIPPRINEEQGWVIQQRGKISKHIFENRGGLQFKNFPTVSPICTGDDGISDRLDSITFPKWRNESIKAGGNAIVPQVVYQIFKTIEQYENLHKM